MNTEEIKTKIKGEIDTSEETLVKYSRDASIFEVRPEVVVFPKDTDDLKALVKWVASQKQNNPELSLTARSAGTDMSGGPLNESIIVDFNKHFNKILEVGRDYAVTQPGVFYRDFEKETVKHQLLLPCYPASRELCTVGGMVANNSAGEKTLVYGQTRNFVENLKVVLSDGQEYSFGPLTENEVEAKMRLPNFEGQIYRQMFQLVKDNYELIQQARPQTSKNSAGYYLWDVWDKRKFDLTQVLCGSQGTLGLVTEIKFRLVKPKPKSRLLVLFLNDLKNLGNIVKTVMEHKPETFESFDDHTFSLAMRFLPGMLKKMKGNIIKLAWQFLPEVWMTITGGIPKLILIAEFTGEDEQEILGRVKFTQNQVEQKFRIKTHITKSEAEAQKYWTVRRESFNLLRQHVSGKQTAPFIDDIVVRPEQLPEFLPKLNRILEQYPSLIYTIAGHAGDANFHIIPLMDLSKPSERAIIPKLSETVYSLVMEFNGSITAEHNDGLIRTPYLEKMYGAEMCRLFAEVKKIFDPHGIFNPRKKVGGDLGYAMAHIKRS